MSNFPKVQQNFNAPVYGVTEKIVKDQVTELKPDYIVRFIAWVFPGESDLVYKELLVTNISLGVTTELAKKIKFDDADMITPELQGKTGKVGGTSYLSVYIAPEIFQKFLITNTGSNYTVQTVDVPRLLEYWEALGFTGYIKS
jgi:hypothetical protein